jgi:hypothetical protein
MTDKRVIPLSGRKSSQDAFKRISVKPSETVTSPSASLLDWPAGVRIAWELSH